MLAIVALSVAGVAICGATRAPWGGATGHGPRAGRLNGEALATMATKASLYADAAQLATAQIQALHGRSAIEWNQAVAHAGLVEFSQAADAGPDVTDAQFLAQAAEVAMASKAKWTPLFHEKTPFHADDYAIGQAFLALQSRSAQPQDLEPLKTRADALAAQLVATKDDPKLTFWWCDALFMAPPVLARLSAVTGDKKYIDAMDSEWWRTTAQLYDKDEHLYYRDAHFLGKKVFWSRGNGWVMGGLARTMTYMPADYPSRPKYEALFKEMAARLVTLQRPDGTWPPNLTQKDASEGPETSGTAFYTYAFAWGVNHGLLPREQYLPAAAKGWAAIMASKRSNGLIGWAQGVGDRPAKAKREGSQYYTTGATLMAALELANLAPFELPAAPEFPAEAPSVATTEPGEGAFCFARHVPERMDDIAWENDRIAHRIYGPALQHNPKEHSGSGIDVWVKKVRTPVINEWYKSGDYHRDRGTGLDFYEVGASRGDGGLGIWDNGQLYISADWVDHEILELGRKACGFTISYAPWDANGRKVWEHRQMTLRAESNLDRIESTLDSDKPGEIIVGIGLAKREGQGGRVFKDKATGVMSYWQPPEKDGTIGVGVVVDPASIVDFTEDKLNYLVLVRATAGKPFVYYAGACWDKGLDFHSADEWEKYLKEFRRE